MSSHHNSDLNHVDPSNSHPRISFLLKQNLILAPQYFLLSQWHRPGQFVPRVSLNSNFLRVVLVAIVGVLDGTATLVFDHAGAVFLFDVGVWVSPS